MKYTRHIRTPEIHTSHTHTCSHATQTPWTRPPTNLRSLLHLRCHHLTRTHTHIHTQTHTHTHLLTCKADTMDTPANTSALSAAFALSPPNARTHAHTHTHTHTHIQTYIHTYTLTHTHTCSHAKQTPWTHPPLHQSIQSHDQQQLGQLQRQTRETHPNEQQKHPQLLRMQQNQLLE